MLQRLLRALGNPPIQFHLAWNRERVSPDGVRAAHEVHIANRRTLMHLALDYQMAFGDAYTAGDIEVSGDLVAFMLTLFRTPDHLYVQESALTRALQRLNAQRRSSVAAARDNIHRHYDLGNEFYELWLGDSMAYTCAYYDEPQCGLDHAQFAKMDHVCRKIRLGPADTVVEAGCGWGSLALHMAGKYGAKVRAFNISREQIDYARRRAREKGLDGRVEFIEDDYRNIHGQYDAFVSVGMLEHVGLVNYPDLGRVVRRSLTHAGRGLIHSIGHNRPEPLQPWIERRIFPGAYPPSLGEMAQIFEAGNLSVLDVENLRLHYALTLRDWLQRFDGALDRVRAMFSSEAFIRMWRLYLAGSIAAFETGTLQLYQVVFTTPENNAIPMTRDFLYRH
ncbi:MAG: class I SAM-dependent methyltransferase [Steroidobacterales bacterium]